MRHLFVWMAAALSTLGMLPSTWAQQQSGPYHGQHMWNDGSWMFFGPMMMIIFIAAIVLVVILAVRWLGGSGHSAAQHPPPGRTPLEILKERFARGEIDKEEFEERRRVLGE